MTYILLHFLPLSVFLVCVSVVYVSLLPLIFHISISFHFLLSLFLYVLLPTVFCFFHPLLFYISTNQIGFSFRLSLLFIWSCFCSLHLLVCSIFLFLTLDSFTPISIEIHKLISIRCAIFLKHGNDVVVFNFCDV